MAIRYNDFYETVAIGKLLITKIHQYFTNEVKTFSVSWVIACKKGSIKFIEIAESWETESMCNLYFGKYGLVLLFYLKFKSSD